ncbi:hypothetical protein FOBRF1_016537 [Fusarium oxysporum]
MFERLPQELLKFIISEISIKDVKNLSQTSNTSILLLCIPSGNLLVFTKSIGLRFVTENNARACPHDRRLQTCQEASDEETVDELGSFVKSKEVILSLLEKCEKEQLTSFSWDQGTCIPTPILGTNGIVTRQQSTLSNLKLTTHPFCQRYKSGEQKIDLSAFEWFTNLFSVEL